MNPRVRARNSKHQIDRAHRDRLASTREAWTANSQKGADWRPLTSLLPATVLHRAPPFDRYCIPEVTIYRGTAIIRNDAESFPFRFGHCQYLLGRGTTEKPSECTPADHDPQYIASASLLVPSRPSFTLRSTRADLPAPPRAVFARSSFSRRVICSANGIPPSSPICVRSSSPSLFSPHGVLCSYPSRLPGPPYSLPLVLSSIALLRSLANVISPAQSNPPS
jgi:hypothetical protein